MSRIESANMVIESPEKVNFQPCSSGPKYIEIDHIIKKNYMHVCFISSLPLVGFQVLTESGMQMRGPQQV